jgi:hypothetical protein
MKGLKVLLMVLGMMLVFGGVANAALDVVESPTGFFVPSDAQKYDSPYYRWNGDDWGWTHSAILGSIASANLNISAFDVDYSDGESDEIFAMDNGTWVSLGLLQGGNDIWQFTDFALGANFFDDINTGLQVKIVIDTDNSGWAVTLAKSSLTTDGSTNPNPNPGAVPEPATMLLLGFGLMGLAGMKRKLS